MRFKRLFQKRNLGFTLVELVIVVAIIAVLSATLAPTYIRYIEKSSISVDEIYIGQVAHSLEVLSAENNNVYTAPVTVTFNNAGKIQGCTAAGSNAAATKAAVDAELATLYPADEQHFSSRYYKGTAAESSAGVTLVLDNAGKVTISGTKNLNN